MMIDYMTQNMLIITSMNADIFLRKFSETCDACLKDPMHSAQGEGKGKLCINS